jgi:hypothetical protein
VVVGPKNCKLQAKSGQHIPTVIASVLVDCRHWFDDTICKLQAKSVLRMLTAMVTLGPAAAKLILTKLNWDSPSWETLPKRNSLKVRITRAFQGSVCYKSFPGVVTI